MYTLDGDDIVSLVAMWLLFLAEIYAGFIHLIGCFVNISPLDRPKLSLDNYDDNQIPTIDILVPSYNESVELLDITLRAALMIDYPQDKLRVHLLDDGGTDQKINQANKDAGKNALERRRDLQKLSSQLSITYHTRKENLHAKAGNINSALENLDGELIVILDADHVPTRDFLSRTVPWIINDDKVFLVQSPHFMTNPDPIERNYFSAFTRMPSENDMFYGQIQRGLDFWNASFFCGSAALLRRKHIDMVGGIAGDSITEDAETALELHSLGYKSVYVNIPMISGMATETFTAFIQQRIRWAQGMAQILILKKPFLNPGLDLNQKLGYMSSILFWFFPFARLIFLLSPLAYLLFGVELINASFVEILAYTIPHFIVSLRISNILFGKNRWALVSELYEILQSTFLFTALITVFKNPKNPTFLVTPKGEDLTENYVSTLSTIFYWLLLFLSLGFFGGIYHFIAYPDSWHITALVFAWNCLNLILCLGLLDVLIEKKQIRSSARIPAYDDVQLCTEEGQCWSANLIDLSINGAKLRLKDSYIFPDELQFIGYSNALKQQINLTCSVIAQNENSKEVRIQFTPQSEIEKNQIIAFTLGDSSRWETFQKGRTRPVSYFYGITHVLKISINPLILHIRMKFKKSV
jgi:cellulose synthase (UDP-forming)